MYIRDPFKRGKNAEAHCDKNENNYRNHETNMRTCAHLGYMC